jgi:glycosyltransferase involved in cell wall biosynthesis
MILNSKVLVAVPVHNGAAFIETAIKSLLKQDYPFLRIIAVEDCSQDNTYEILKKYDERLQIVRNDVNRGLAYGLNYALSLAKNEELFIILEDDVELINPDYISRSISHFNDERVAIICGQPVDFTPQRLSLLDRTFARYLNYDYQTQGITEMHYSAIKADIIRISALREIGGFNFAGNPKLGAEDQILANQLRQKHYKILKDASLTYRLGFARMRGLKGFYKSEANAGVTLGVAVRQKLISAHPDKSPEAKAKRNYRYTQVGVFGLLIISLFLCTIFYKIALGILFGTLLLEIINCIKKSHGFSLGEKPFFVGVGLVNDIVFPINFIKGYIVSFIKR